MRWAPLRPGWLQGAGALALAAAAALSFAACGDADEDRAGLSSGPWPRDWISGGQTGSLMPACGLSAAAIERGVPASAPGVVLRTDACGDDPSAFDALTVRDASGQPVAFSLVRLADGSLLIDVQGGLTPGRYSVDFEPELAGDGGLEPDEDGGLSQDASIAPVMPDAGALSSAETIEVAAEQPRPQRFGTIERLGDACNAVLTFVPDAAVLPFLSVLAVDLQIDEGPLVPLVRPGALPVQNGLAGVRLPTDSIEAAGGGYHTLTIVTRIAGESVPLETFLLSVEVPCGFTGGESGASSPYEEDDGACTVGAPGAGEGWHARSALLGGLALFALRRRRRRHRA